MTTQTTSQEQDKPIFYVNASLLKSGGCDLKLQRIITGLRRKHGHAAKDEESGGDYKMAYGSAFHKFAELYYNQNGPSVEECIQATVDEYMMQEVPASDNVRTVGALDNVCSTYAKKHPRNEFVPITLDNKPALEVKFVWPVRQHELFEMAVTGTLDIIAQDIYKQTCIVDHKTTSSRVINDFLRSYYKDIQAMLYVVMERRISGRDHYLPFVVNGVFLRKGGAEFARETIAFTDDELIAFERWLDRRLDEIYIMLTDYITMGGRAREERSQCKQFFGSCQFWDLCQSGSGSELSKSLEKAHYERTPYDPTEWH